ncbi:MAG: TauD/TfdA family dioxygenase [Alphaproteobacteria bacterium]|nr:TauD/TfdA family dioxygenase [Alphaproteobacteria bacterium]
MDTMTGLTATPLSPALGAEVGGLDLREDLSPETVDAIRELWQRHLVLVFRGQQLTTDQQRRFAANFGTLGRRKRESTAFAKSKYALYEGDPAIREDPNLVLVSNITVEGKPIGSFAEADMWFHIDSGYAERPYKYTLLYSIKLPSEGGNTLFANMYSAYETLPEDLKAKLSGRKALHIHEYKRRDKVDVTKDISASPHYFHPVFTTHPETGRKSLFVDRLMTARIEGLDAEDSARTLAHLFDHAESPEFVYEHVWRLGDLVMWDNRCVTHGRTYFPEDQERILRRCTVEGEPPYE